jgi:predicted cupin superfamily sugar epimerase
MNQKQIEELIKKFDMAPHPEGGFFCETYRSDDLIDTPRGPRAASTAITFLLRQGDISHFHRIKSDELWHFYHGDGLEIFEITEAGEITTTVLSQQNPQHLVPANRWFASKPAEGSRYSFVGCTVSPGFDFEDFEMGSKEKLLAQFPQHELLIKELSLTTD